MTEMKQIVRIINSDILGETQIHKALTSIYGVGPSFSSVVCNVLNMDYGRKIGTLTNEEVKKVEDVIKNPGKYKVPDYMYNRRKDIETGEDKHIITADLKLSGQFDVKRLQRIRSYRGIRHALGLPLRGQRTRSNFRKGKSLGVSKKKNKQQAKKKTQTKVSPKAKTGAKKK